MLAELVWYRVFLRACARRLCAWWPCVEVMGSLSYELYDLAAENSNPRLAKSGPSFPFCPENLDRVYCNRL